MRIGLSLGLKSTTTNLSVTRTLEGIGQVKDTVQIKSCLVVEMLQTYIQVNCQKSKY